jgi:hypothetical protein
MGSRAKMRTKEGENEKTAQPEWNEVECRVRPRVRNKSNLSRPEQREGETANKECATRARP